MNFTLDNALFCLLLLLTITAPFATAKPGPVISSDFADPSLIEVNGTWYAFATGDNGVNAGLNIQLASSKDFSTWTLHRNYDALPHVGSKYGQVWAPDVSLAPDRQTYNMFFTAMTPKHNKKHCVYVATSPHLTGPYTVLSDAAKTTIACDLKHGGDIDATVFVDDALPRTPPNQYLIYKRDGNADGSEYWKDSKCTVSSPLAPTPFLLQLVDPLTGIKTLGKPRVLFNSIKSDGPCIEAPALLYDNGYYYLIFNDGCYQDKTYSVHYAICKGQYLASCQWQRAKHPLLQSGQNISGAEITAPGGVSVRPYTNSKGEQAWRMVFHGDVNRDWFSHGAKSRKVERVRGMYAAELIVERGTLRAGQLY